MPIQFLGLQNSKKLIGSMLGLPHTNASKEPTMPYTMPLNDLFQHLLKAISLGYTTIIGPKESVHQIISSELRRSFFNSLIPF